MSIRKVRERITNEGISGGDYHLTLFPLESMSSSLILQLSVAVTLTSEPDGYFLNSLQQSTK